MTTDILVKFKRFVMRLWANIPFGYLARFKHGDLTVTIHKNLLVVISDGESDDALPLNYCSEEFIAECGRQLEMRGYA